MTGDFIACSRFDPAHVEASLNRVFRSIRPCSERLRCDAQHGFSLFDNPRIAILPRSKAPRAYIVLAGALPGVLYQGDVDLRTLAWHRGAAVMALRPALSCRSCRPNAPFAEVACLSKSSVANEYYAERSGNRWVSEWAANDQNKLRLGVS